MEKEGADDKLKRAEAAKLLAEAKHFERSWIASTAGILGSLTGFAGIGLAIVQYVASERKNQESEQALKVAEMAVEKAEIESKYAEELKRRNAIDLKAIQSERANALRLAESAKAEREEIEAAKEESQKDLSVIQAKLEQLTLKADAVQDFLDMNDTVVAAIEETPGGEEFVSTAKNLVDATREVETQVEQTNVKIDKGKTRVYIHCANELQAAKARRLSDEMKSDGWAVQYVRNVGGRGFIPDSTEVRYFRHPGERALAEGVLSFLQDKEFIPNSRVSFVEGYDSENRPRHIEIWMHEGALSSMEEPSIHEHEWRTALQNINAPDQKTRTEAVNKLAFLFNTSAVKDSIIQVLESKEADEFEDQYVVNAVIILARHPSNSWSEDQLDRMKILLSKFEDSKMTEGQKWAFAQLRQQIDLD